MIRAQPNIFVETEKADARKINAAVAIQANQLAIHPFRGAASGNAQHQLRLYAYSVRYDAVNAMLLNEFLKERRKVQELEEKMAQQQRDFTTRLRELDSKIQTVSDRVELKQPTAQVVDNHQ